MAFRNGAYATVWEVTPISDTMTKCKISTSRKDKETGGYETDFSAYVAFVGTAVAQQAAHLKERDRIRVNETSVTTKYDKDKGTVFYNFKVFAFEKAQSYSDSLNAVNVVSNDPKPKKEVDDGEVEDFGLPF